MTSLYVVILHLHIKTEVLLGSSWGGGEAHQPSYDPAGGVRVTIFVEPACPWVDPFPGHGPPWASAGHSASSALLSSGPPTLRDVLGGRLSLGLGSSRLTWLSVQPETSPGPPPRSNLLPPGARAESSPARCTPSQELTHRPLLPVLLLPVLCSAPPSAGENVLSSVRLSAFSMCFQKLLPSPLSPLQAHM